MLTDLMAAAGLTVLDREALLFTSPGGGPLRYTNWLRRSWSPATIAAGLGRLVEDEASGRRHYVGLGFHDLRRASATSLVAAGVDVKTAQTVLALGRPADARPLRPGRDGAAAGGGRRHGGEVHRRVAAGKRGAEPPTGDRQDPAENGGEGL
jgi:hypothetical protein